MFKLRGFARDGIDVVGFWLAIGQVQVDLIIRALHSIHHHVTESLQSSFVVRSFL